MLLTIALVSLTILIVIYVKRRRNLVSIADKVPGPKATALFGLLGNIDVVGAFKEDRPDFPRLALIFERINALCELYGKNGMLRMWLQRSPTFWITNQRCAEVILNSKTQITKSDDYDRLHDWLSQGLLTSSGEKWKTRRKLLTSAFHFRILEDFLDVMNDQAKTCVNILRSKTKEDWIDICPLITKFTLDIICETAMGVNMDIQNSVDSAYLSNLHSLSKLFIERGPKPWLHTDWIYKLTSDGRKYFKSVKFLHKFTLKIIQDKKATFKGIDDNPEDDKLNISTKKKRLAFLDLLLNENRKDPKFQDSDMREEVDTFMFAGHDTTAMGLSWTLYLIGLYPDVQKRIVEELESIFGDDIERQVTFDDIKEMKYLECVIKESHRLYPPVPYIGRRTTEEIVIDGYTIPKGSQVWVLFFILQRDSSVFPNPIHFNPDNFLQENSSGRNPFAYVPFSAGLRNCIGQKFAQMEEKTALAHILRNFCIESLDHRDKVATVAEMVLRPVGGIRMRFSERRANV